MDQNKIIHGINQSTLNSNNSKNSDKTLPFAGNLQKRHSEQNKCSITSENSTSNNLQNKLDGERLFQDTLILDRRSDSVNHQQSLNQFLNSKQNSEVHQDKQNSTTTPNNSSKHKNTRNKNKLTLQNKEGNSQASKNMSSIAPPSYASHRSKKKIQKMTTQDELATLQEDREPHASRLSDENGRIIYEMSDVQDRFFYKSGLKGIIFLVSESSHAAIAILPYFFSQFGILLAIILILTLIVVSNFSFFYLLKAKNLSRRSNYHTIAQYLSGVSGYRFIFIVQFLTKFSNCTILMHFAAKQLHQFILNVQHKQNYSESDLAFPESYIFCLILMALCMIALSLFVVLTYQTTFTQVINISFLLIMFILTLISFINTLQNEELKGDFIFVPEYFQFGYAFSTLALLFFLLDIHINFFNVYKFMRKPSDKKMLRTSLYANMILGLCYISIGSFGYITTTDLDRNVNYLISFSQLNLHLTFSSIALLAFVLYCLINFPLQFSIARSHIIKIIRSMQSNKSSQIEGFPQDYQDRDHLEKPGFYKSSSNDINEHNHYYQSSQPNIPSSPQFGNVNNPNDLNNQLISHDLKQYDDQSMKQTHITVRRIRFYTITIIISVLMFAINFFILDPLIIVLISGVFFSSVNAFIIPIAFYIKLSNYESTFVVISSVLLLFTILGLDFTTLLGEVFTLIE